jgi:poly-gamma-glutamate capsule biosynthesis protein CapA/YwtB (metallophosphatase superfamily)
MPTRKYLRITSRAALLLVCAVTLSCQGKDLTTPIAEAETTTHPLATPTPETTDSITIAAVGDVMLGSPFPNESRMPPNDGADILKGVTPILSAADIAFGNMEGPIIDGGVSEKCGTPKPGEPIRCFAFRMPTRFAKNLKAAGFDVMSVANNHASVFGDAGRASTRKTLDAIGIKHAGSDRVQYSTTYLDVKGVKVAFVGFAHNNIVPNVNDLDTARRLVQEADTKADIVIVSFHGGPAHKMSRSRRSFSSARNAGIFRSSHTPSSTPVQIWFSVTVRTCCGRWRSIKTGLSIIRSEISRRMGGSSSRPRPL